MCVCSGGGGVCSWGVSTSDPRRVSAPGVSVLRDVCSRGCLLLGGCLLQGCLLLEGSASGPGGCLSLVRGGCLPLVRGGGCVSQHALGQTPHCEQNGRQV